MVGGTWAELQPHLSSQLGASEQCARAQLYAQPCSCRQKNSSSPRLASRPCSGQGKSRLLLQRKRKYCRGSDWGTGHSNKLKAQFSNFEKMMPRFLSSLPSYWTQEISRLYLSLIRATISHSILGVLIPQDGHQSRMQLPELS